MMKIGKIMIVIALLGTLFVSTKSQEIQTVLGDGEKLGDLVNYNAIIRQDYHADQADVEGSIAVGGHMIAPAISHHDYSIGAAYAGANGQHIGAVFDSTLGPALLLGGNYTNKGNGLHVFGDFTTYSGNAYQGIEVNGQSYVVEKQVIIDHIDSMIERADVYLSQALSYEISTSAKIDGGAGWNSSGISFFLATIDQGINIGIVAGINEAHIGEVYLPSNIVNQEATILVSTAETIRFLPGGTLIYNGSQINVNQLYNEHSDFTKIASRIVYYFPNAKEVILEQQGVIGSIYAPNAHFIATGGSINGQAIFNSAAVGGGFEFHNFSFMWRRELGVGEVIVHKIDQETLLPLMDAEFEILKADTKEVVDVQISDEQGELRFEDLAYGTYILRESRPPTGYQSDFNDMYFEVSMQQQVIVIRAYNTPQQEEFGSIKVIKVDNQNSLKLAGAEFSLINYQSKEVIVSGVTDEQGQLEFNNLPYGVYQLIEDKAPQGYLLETNKQHLINVNNAIVHTIRINNQKASQGSLRVHKKDSQGSVLSGVTFALWNEDASVYLETVSDEDGWIEFLNLPKDKYYLQEVDTLENYILDDHVRTFTISEEVYEIEIELINYLIGTIPEDLEEGAVKIQKKDAEDHTLYLEGAVFRLTHLENDEVFERASDAFGIIEFSGLPYGQYKLEEISAPAGYYSKGAEIVLDIDANLRFYQYQVSNDKIDSSLGSILIHKYDDETYEALADTTFSLENQKTHEIWYAQTDGSGDAKFLNIPYGQYVLKEVESPLGYQISETEIQVDVTMLVKRFIIPFPNVKQSITDKELMIQKLDQFDDSMVLSGAQYRIEDCQGNFVGRAVTDEFGITWFKEIDVSLESVCLYEEVAPEGYELDEDVVVVHLNVSGVNRYYLQVRDQRKTGTVLIEKTLLEQVYGEFYDYSQIEMMIYGNEHIREVIRFDATGKVVVNLPPGFYSLREIAVPENMSLNGEIFRFEIRANETYELNIENIALDIPLTIWLVKSDNLQERLVGIPFELLMIDLLGEVHSYGIAYTQDGTQDFLHETTGVASWQGLTRNDIFDHNGDLRIQNIYAVEVLLPYDIGVIQDTETKYYVDFDTINFAESHVQIMGNQHENGDIINQRREEGIVDPPEVEIELPETEVDPPETEITLPEVENPLSPEEEIILPEVETPLSPLEPHPILPLTGVEQTYYTNELIIAGIVLLIGTSLKRRISIKNNKKI